MPAYLVAMLEASQAGRLSEPLTRERIERAGRATTLYPGVDTLFGRLRDELAAHPADVSVEFYVITSGLERLVASTSLRRELTQLWGCEVPTGGSRVPFAHMIYVGDGYTDVPCFSLWRGAAAFRSRSSIPSGTSAGAAPGASSRRAGR